MTGQHGNRSEAEARSISSRKKRRADGSLRPSYRRYRKKTKARQVQTERAAWLANFAPGERDKFFKFSDAARNGVWLRAFARKLGVPQEKAWPQLEALANENRWMKLRTRDGVVVGIAPPRPVPSRTAPVIHPPARSSVRGLGRHNT